MKITDEHRLDYLIKSGSYLGWNRNGLSCRVFSPDIVHTFKPVCGWNSFFNSGKDAIDAAMKKSRFLSRDWE